MTYKLGSLFDGSGGFPLAGSLCGITPAWASEVEPYPIAVTRSRFPGMKHLGDISKINGGEVEPVDIITFGSPCQDLSVAGKRAGLKHEANGDDETTRSGLFMEAVRIIKEMRRATNGKYPSFALWENVPGAFSSNKGEDFRIVCEELIKIVEPKAFMPAVPKNGWPYADSYCGDGWSLAYRVFDAQYWRVAQRRRRIHLVLDLRGERAREVLFEREGVRGYFAQSGTPWQGIASHAENSTGADDREESVPYLLKIRSGCEGGGKDPLWQKNMSATLATNNDQYLFQPVPNLLLDDQGGSQITVRTDGKAPTLRAEMHGNVPCVMESGGFCPEQSAKTRGIGWEEEMSPTLRAGVTPGIVYSVENHPADSRVNIDDSGKVQTLTSRMGTGGGNVPMVMEPVAYNGENITSPLNKTNPQPGDPCHTLGTDSRNYLVYCLQGNGIDRADTAGCNGKGWKEDTCYTLNTIDRPAVAYLASGEESEPPAVHYIVRRLTPTECARLQGFADKWGHPDRKDDFTEEEYRFWLDVRNTHATVIGGKEAKEYTKEQMLKWYNSLHTDSAEYKMWGNGIALPPALYCMQGIRDALDAFEETEAEDVQEEIPAPVVVEETEAVEEPAPEEPEVVEEELPKPVQEAEEPKREMTKSDLISAYAKLYKHRDHLTRQQIRTLKGQIKAGDVEGAMHGLQKLLKREGR